MEKYKTYIEETDLHYKLMDFINPESKYGLDKQIKNTDGADSRDFKRGAMWGAAMFLLFASAGCDKIHCKILTDEERELREQFEASYEQFMKMMQNQDRACIDKNNDLLEKIKKIINIWTKNNWDQYELAKEIEDREDVKTCYNCATKKYEYYAGVADLGNEILGLLATNISKNKVEEKKQE